MTSSSSKKKAISEVVLPEASRKKSYYYRYIIFIYALVSTGLAAGVVYGWPAFRRTLINENTTLNETQLDSIFTVGSWSTIGGRFFFGLARDSPKIGTKITGCIALFCACVGSLGLGLSNPSDLLTLTISMLLLGLGSGIQLCLQPIAIYFPNNQGIIISSISGSFLISGLVFLVLTSISVNRKHVFIGFTCILGVLLFFAVLLLPRNTFHTASTITTTTTTTMTTTAAAAAAAAAPSTTNITHDDDDDDKEGYTTKDELSLTMMKQDDSLELNHDDALSSSYYDLEKNEEDIEEGNSTDDENNDEPPIITTTKAKATSIAAETTSELGGGGSSEQQQQQPPPLLFVPPPPPQRHRTSVRFILSEEEFSATTSPSGSSSSSSSSSSEEEESAIQLSNILEEEEENDDDVVDTDTKLVVTKRPSTFFKERMMSFYKLPGTAAKEQMMSLEYVGLIIWFSVTLIPIQCYIATLGYQLEQKGDDDGFYTNLFLYFYAAAAFFSPIAGKLADKFGMGIAQGVATILTSLSFFILAFDDIPLQNGQVVGLLLHALGRMMDFGMFFTCIGKRFGYTNYGTLLGVGLLISGTIGLLQAPLIVAVDHGNEYFVNIASGVALLCLLPYCAWLARKERKE